MLPLLDVDLVVPVLLVLLLSGDRTRFEDLSYRL